MGVWHVVCVWAYKSFASEHLTHKIENQNPFQVLPKTGQKKTVCSCWPTTFVRIQSKFLHSKESFRGYILFLWFLWST